ncbi:MAG: hypothetical protein ISQ08_04615 [Planctomycetes bacterium]|nr:hypothetical protein [Planctomycetota bacterium]
MSSSPRARLPRLLVLAAGLLPAGLQAFADPCGPAPGPALGQEPSPAPALAADLPATPGPLEEREWSRLVDWLTPPVEELEWLEIGWAPTLEEGVRRAALEGRPLLLWAMNGHPLGCT